MKRPGQVTYGEAFTVQPFNNLVVTQSLTGAQIKGTLEQSFIGCFGRTQATVILQVSAEIHYTYNAALPCGSRITGITVNGTPIDPAATYKVAMNNFLADGGDSFPGFKAGTGRVYAPGFDVDALTAYLGAHSPVAPGPQDRITNPLTPIERTRGNGPGDGAVSLFSGLLLAGPATGVRVGIVEADAAAVAFDRLHRLVGDPHQ